MNKLTTFIQLLESYDSECKVNISNWANNPEEERKALLKLHEEVMDLTKKYVGCKEWVN